MMTLFQPIVGLVGLVVFAWAISENRRRFPWRMVVVGLALQFALALLLTKLPVAQTPLTWIGNAVDALMQATQAGTSLVFGFLGGAPLPFEEQSPGASFVFAFRSPAAGHPD